MDTLVGPEAPTNGANFSPLAEHREKGADPRTEHGAKKLRTVRLLPLPVSAVPRRVCCVLVSLPVSLLFFVPVWSLVTCLSCFFLALSVVYPFLFLCDGRRPQNRAFLRHPLLIRSQPLMNGPDGRPPNGRDCCDHGTLRDGCEFSERSSWMHCK